MIPGFGHFPPLTLGLICRLLPQIFRSFKVILNSVFCHILTVKVVHFGKYLLTPQLTGLEMLFFIFN